MPFLRKYAVLLATGTTSIRIPIIKRAVVDFALGADWTPAAGDVRISIDGAADANVTNLPTAIAAGNTAFWEFILTAAELTGQQMIVTVADAATKAVEDQAFIVETYGHASARYITDLGLQLATPTNITAGTITTATNVTTVNGLAAAVITAASIAADAITDAKVAADVTIASVTGAVGSVTGGVTVTTNNDKSGYALTQAFPANFSAMSISVTTGLVDITQTAADKAWSTAARVLTSGTNIALAKGTGVTGFNDLDAAGVAAATWNAATVTYGTAGSYGLLFETNLDAAITSRMATYTQPTGFLAATFPGTVASTTNITLASGITVATNSDKTGYTLTQTFPTNFAARVISAGGTAAADVTAVAGATATATKLNRVLIGNVTGTVGAGSTTTSIVTSALDPAASVADQYKGRIVTFADNTTTAALRGQSSDITASTSLGVLTVTALTTAAVSGDTFVIS